MIVALLIYIFFLTNYIHIYDKYMSTFDLEAVLLTHLDFPILNVASVPFEVCTGLLVSVQLVIEHLKGLLLSPADSLSPQAFFSKELKEDPLGKRDTLCYTLITGSWLPVAFILLSREDGGGFNG